MRCERRLVLALDETDGTRAMDVARSVARHVDAIKINWPIVLSMGPEVITRLSELSDVICDFKVADIPNTDRLIVEQCAERGAAAVIVHGFTGRDSLEAAIAAKRDMSIFVVSEMSHPGGVEFTAPAAERIVRMAVDAGADGIIAPATRPGRIAELRPLVGDGLILSPGVGAQGGSPVDAIRAGADHVIVGRSIYGADDPEGAATSIVESIAEAGLL